MNLVSLLSASRIPTKSPTLPKLSDQYVQYIAHVPGLLQGWLGFARVVRSVTVLGHVGCQDRNFESLHDQMTILQKM